MTDAVTRSADVDSNVARASVLPARGKPVTRSQLFWMLGAAVASIASLWLIYYWLVGSHYVSTDNAYVGANVAIVTPQIAGAISEVPVNDTQEVRRGDVLARIDPADAELAVAQAEADYGRAVRRVRGYLASNDANAASISAREADIDRAKAQLASASSDLERAQIDLNRRQTLARTGAVSQEVLTTATNVFETAQAARDAAVASHAQARANQSVARGQYEVGLTLTQGVDVEANPEVAAAKATLDVARLNLARTAVRAPIDGMIARRRVQVGQRVAIGAELMTVVPLRDVYVDANFKEGQLAKIKPGQSAELTSDRYGGSVVFHGRVVGVGGGTGAAFALIPAQNATGNWIKVVQRVPVRIALEPRELADHSLRVGLSMEATVDVASGGDATRTEP